MIEKLKFGDSVLVQAEIAGLRWEPEQVKVRLAGSAKAVWVNVSQLRPGGGEEDR